ncbi:MAG: DEAD/DEAH box helicase family protein [Candidatus Thermoplasmatota archaeon]|nr:DEAD/DEAH box helicase family protein [Candidatus Thermoplasmatota archaeon]
MSGISSYIDPDTLEKREYQVNIFENIKEKDSLVVLPTGLGKTIIAVFLICWKLESGKKTLMMAPTRPLCKQHLDFLLDSTSLNENDIELLTGELYSPEERKEIWEGDAKIFLATPQTVNNDLHEIPIGSIDLMVFDEVHRATGDYAYVEIGKACKEKMQFLGLTASPGSSLDKLVEVCANLEIENIEVRKETDDDVEPYVSEKIMEWTELEKNEELVVMEEWSNSLLEEFIEELSDYTKQARNLKAEEIGKSVLIDIQEDLQERIKKENKGYLFHALSLTSASIKISHLKELILTQGIDAAHRYYLNLLDDESRATKYIKKREEFDRLGEKLMDLKAMPVEINPKLNETKKILREELEDGNAMVFAQYRDTVEYLVKELERMEDIFPSRLVGQSDREADHGMSQDEQGKVLESFRDGETNVLVSTSIGEEGLDIPSTELVIFYEPVPSAIRSIQRKGRTGRNSNLGKVHVLLTEDSKDEAFYWKSRHEEKKMYDHVYELKKELENSENPKSMMRSLKTRLKVSQSDLEDF